ncbi:hypothetical protein WICMUC_001387 [Wickerhamomyces mucosus]|uniref:DNA replication complex GINS protein SLD5 n=1 Tax=Wickerhamomyces mucosus TaxID=1378264 RepID=A0A9P8PVH3_9ASCO|nr:hypothetical protein WICMUC_001387 [Wickerhamomyces mucosus]
MATNFDDILADFDNQVNPNNRLTLTKLKRQDLQLLQTVWINERMAPELLTYEHELIERILSRLRDQVEFIELNSIDIQNTDKDIKLKLVVIESELGRVNFLLRSYLRTRLSKIDRLTVFIRTSDEFIQRLSEEETIYMENHFKSLVQLYNNLFLNTMPEQLQSLDDESGGISMIEQPDWNKPVFIRVVNDIKESIIVGDEEVELEKEGIYLLRYSAVKNFVHNRDVVLI